MRNLSRKQRNHMNALAGSMERLALDNAARRTCLEKIWVQSFRQLEGRMDPAKEQELHAAEQSSSSANWTRPKTDAAIARILDILFPKDDDPFVLEHTPIPEINALQGSKEMFAQGAYVDAETRQPITQEQAYRELLQEAKRRTTAMNLLVKDQMMEARWPVVARQMITSGCEYGTGIVKGPVVQGRNRQGWRQVEEGGRIEQVLESVPVLTPGLEYVDIWKFFPDMSACLMSEAEFIFVRHVLNRRGLRRLARQPGFDEKAIIELMELGPTRETTVGNYWAEMREITGVNDQDQGEVWEVWEVHKPFGIEDFEAGDITVPKGFGMLDDPQAEFWFCNGIALKFALNPLEPQELPFSVFVYDRDPNCIFGRGLPYRMRNSQGATDASWRMMLDNGGLAAGGQIVVDKSCSPSASSGKPGNYTFKKRGFWTKDDPNVPIANVFGQFTFDAQLEELGGIYNMASQLIEMESGIPSMVNADASSNMAQTASGLTQLTNIALTLAKRPVKNFDDDVSGTLPVRFYNWNMANHKDQSIKGDMVVIPRGADFLIAKELKAQNAVWLGQTAFGTPALEEHVNVVSAFKALVKSAQHEPTDWIKPESLASENEPANPEGEAPTPEQQMAEAQQQQMQMEMQVKQGELQVKQMEMQIRQAELNQRDRESERQMQVEMMKLAAEGEVSIATLRQDMGIKAMEDQTKNRGIDAKLEELDFKRTTGEPGI